MIECIFTLDYEIYGNGTGSLKDLIYEPAEQLRRIFRKWNVRFVNFVEVAELEKIEECRTDAAIELVKKQVRKLYWEDFEIALHLHPQWCNAYCQNVKWFLDFSEYNLCALPRTRIAQIVQRSLRYLRHIVDEHHFTPLAFRAGNWLFQPTEPAASVLADSGIRIDSSVFKGGLQHTHGLDYRPASKNGYYWPFSSDANHADPAGQCLELPIYTEMVRPWRIPSSKRLGMGNNLGFAGQRWNRMRDFLRFRYPLKFDFCRMTLDELTSMIGTVIEKDRQDPAVYRPLVAIGHTKDLAEPQVVDNFLSFLRANGVGVATFTSVYPKLVAELGRAHEWPTEPHSNVIASTRPENRAYPAA